MLLLSTWSDLVFQNCIHGIDGPVVSDGAVWHRLVYILPHSAKVIYRAVRSSNAEHKGVALSDVVRHALVRPL